VFDVQALGVFLSGAGAVLGGVFSLRALQRRADKDCAQRIEEIRQALHEGWEMHDK